ETFFQDMSHTVNEAIVTASQMEKALEQQRIKIFQNQTKDLTNLMKTPGDQGALLRHHLKYNHPLKAQGSIMMANMYKSDFSTSFEARLLREKEKRAESDKQLLKSLEGITKQINALHKAASKLEGGENGDEELQIEKMLNQACALGQDYQAQLLAGRAAIGDLYIRNVEDLLNQKLQEEIFWSLILGYPADPTASVYKAYSSYLQEINSFRTLYPDARQLSPPCKEDYRQLSSIDGKLQQWEADHCNISWGFDVKVFKGKFDCNGMKAQVNYGPLSAEYGVSQDPATWEITRHTVSVEAGASKEFGVGKKLTGEIGATAGGSVTFDNGGNVVDAGVKGSVGADLSGPMGGSAGVQVGSVEVTMSGGFNSSGPSTNSPGSSFLRGN
ncbi:MAG TPA: hypothetical protein PLR74_08600, partial [Agriterribacter sp.]|nr:hypothetical protein [Agriterribacter sp.]